MRFVFTGYVYTPGFSQPEDWIFRLRAYTGILESLARHHEVISIEQTDYEGEYRQKGVLYLFRNFGKHTLHFPLRLHRLIRKLQPDAVLIHGSCFPLQAMQLRMHLGSSVLVVVQDHSAHPPEGYRKLLQRVADRCIDRYFFTSGAMANSWIQQNLIRNRSKLREVIPGSSVFRPMEKKAAKAVTLASGDQVFLWVGRLDRNKNPLTVVSAFLRARVQLPGAKLYMIYPGKMSSDIGYLLQRHEHGQSVITVGAVPHNQMQYWYSSADFFVSGSYHEVFGAAAVEAMSCGCMPILTDIPSFRKITGAGVCGWLYPAGDEEKLRQIMMVAAEGCSDTGRKDTIRYFNNNLSFDAVAAAFYENCSAG